MPAHTPRRRMEVYFYFDIPEDNVVFHLMGEGKETRHIVIQNEEAVISLRPWEHSRRLRRRNYTFIWAMGGENKAFDDMRQYPDDRTWLNDSTHTITNKKEK